MHACEQNMGPRGKYRTLGTITDFPKEPSLDARGGDNTTDGSQVVLL